MTVSEIGEFGLIDRLVSRLPSRPRSVIVDIGDDAAVLDVGGENYLVITCDVQVENVHFRWSTADPYLLGRRALAINISDVGAMGGWPSYALVSLGMRPSTPVEVLDRLYQGMTNMANAFGISVVGGNVSRCESDFIDITLTGFVRPKSVTRRSGARPGDLILVTGTLGDAYAGLMLLEHLPARAQEFGGLLLAHRDPMPRQIEGRALAEAGVPTAMIDISDGLAGDLRHLAEASRVGACLHLPLIPVSASLKEAADLLGADPFWWALHGGEDYELLFTVPPGKEHEAAKLIRDATGVRCTVVGEVLPEGSGLLAQAEDGTVRPLEAFGHNHFRREERL
jgi:thiamine-monophosphate kinase